MQQRFTYLHPKFEAAPKYVFNESVNRERLRYLCDKDMPLVAYSCLAKGGYESDERIPAEYATDGRLAVIREMAREKGVNTSALVVAWMVNLYRCEGFPRVIPLFASSRVEHFMDNLRGADMILSEEEMERLNRA
jgi:diketogulonate reductase-like aldo/keto reductase